MKVIQKISSMKHENYSTTEILDLPFFFFPCSSSYTKKFGFPRTRCVLTKARHRLFNLVRTFVSVKMQFIHDDALQLEDIQTEP